MVIKILWYLVIVLILNVIYYVIIWVWNLIFEIKDFFICECSNFFFGFMVKCEDKNLLNLR